MNLARQATRLACVFLLGFTGCSSTLSHRAQNADGLLEFIIGPSPEVGVPVEKLSGSGGQIASAHVRAYGTNVFVSGKVSRASLGEPPPASHVDVIVVDGQQKVIESVTVNYLPRDIPHGSRGGPTQSSYTARLQTVPQTGSTVKVRFHGVAKSKCEFGSDS